MARILGLDIERDAIRAAIVKTSFRKVEIERYVEVPLADSTEDSERLANVQQALQQLIQRIGAPADVVIAAMDGRHVSLRHLELPKAAEKRAAEVLPFELESLLPFDVEDAIIDHQVVGRDEMQVELLVAAALERQVAECLMDYQNLGLAPRELCPAPVYLEELTSVMGVTGCCLVIELRQDCTEMAAIVDHRCLATRTLSANFTSWQNTPGSFSRAIKQSLVSFRAGGIPEPKQVILLGSGAAAMSADWLADQVQLPVMVGELPSSITAPEAPIPPAMARALGLARRGLHTGHRLNLRRGVHSHNHQGGGQWNRYGNLVAGCAVAVVAALMFSLKAQQSLLIDEQIRLQDQLATTTEAVFGTSVSTADGAEMLIKQSAGNDPLPRFDALDALAAVSESVSEEITHEVRRLRIEVGDEKREGRLELQGMLTSIEQRDAFAATLEEHPCFRDIEKGKTTSGRGNTYINYQLEAIVQCPVEGAASKKRKK